jgi:hypothetical protein
LKKINKGYDESDKKDSKGYANDHVTPKHVVFDSMKWIHQDTVYLEFLVKKLQAGCDLN